MKQFSILIFLFTLFSCGEKKTEDNFPIDIVLKKSVGHKDKLELGDRLNLNDYKTIDTTFFKKWFEGLTIPELDNRKLAYDHFSQWYYVDHRKIGEKIIFSILNSDEVGFLDLYYLTYDISEKKIIKINFLTQAGGDGGFYKEDFVKWLNNKTIHLITKETDEEHLTDSTSIVQKDSFVAVYNFGDKKLKGKIIFKESKSDTINGE
jgi:hypothetical protein